VKQDQGSRAEVGLQSPIVSLAAGDRSHPADSVTRLAPRRCARAGRDRSKQAVIGYGLAATLRR
jgi:hypothetical protein